MPKRILAFHSSNDFYGASKSFFKTIQAWSRDGNDLTVVLSSEGILADKFREAGIEVIVMPLGILRRKYLNITGLINRLAHMNRTFWKLRHLIKERSVDLVYSNTIGVLVSAFAAKSKGIKHIWHVREITLSPKWFTRFIGFLLNQLSDKVLVVSDEARKHWSIFVDPSKLKMVYNGIDLSPFGESIDLKARLGFEQDTILIGMVARVNFWKGQLYFLEIIKNLRVYCPHVRAVMVGDAYPGYEYIYDEIAAYKKAHGLEDFVIDLGYQSDVLPVLSGLDIFVLPSILPDPLPNTVLEAMASKLPVFATAHGGALEMVAKGLSGEHIPWDDAELSAQIIKPTIQDKQKRRQFGKAGYERVKRSFTLEAYEQEMINILNF